MPTTNMTAMRTPARNRNERLRLMVLPLDVTPQLESSPSH
jgi:hypothetical protein